MPGYFTIDDGKAHKIIYGHGDAWTKGEFYAAWSLSSDPQMENLFTTRDHGYHSTMRRKVASMYSMTSLVSYEPYVDQCIDLLHSHLDMAASAGSVMNLGRWLQFFAFDTVFLITVGCRENLVLMGRHSNNHFPI